MVLRPRRNRPNDSNRIKQAFWGTTNVARRFMSTLMADIREILDENPPPSRLAPEHAHWLAELLEQKLRDKYPKMLEKLPSGVVGLIISRLRDQHKRKGTGGFEKRPPPPHRANDKTHNTYFPDEKRIRRKTAVSLLHHEGQISAADAEKIMADRDAFPNRLDIRVGSVRAAWRAYLAAQPQQHQSQLPGQLPQVRTQHQQQEDQLPVRPRLHQDQQGAPSVEYGDSLDEGLEEEGHCEEDSEDDNYALDEDFENDHLCDEYDTEDENHNDEGPALPSLRLCPIRDDERRRQDQVLTIQQATNLICDESGMGSEDAGWFASWVESIWARDNLPLTVEHIRSAMQQYATTGEELQTQLPRPQPTDLGFQEALWNDASGTMDGTRQHQRQLRPRLPVLPGSHQDGGGEAIPEMRHGEHGHSAAGVREVGNSRFPLDGYDASGNHGVEMEDPGAQVSKNETFDSQPTAPASAIGPGARGNVTASGGTNRLDNFRGMITFRYWQSYGPRRDIGWHQIPTNQRQDYIERASTTFHTRVVSSAVTSPDQDDLFQRSWEELRDLRCIIDEDPDDWGSDPEVFNFIRAINWNRGDEEE